MANEEHLKLIREAIDKKDIGIWNKWREKNFGVAVDLGAADLSGANLHAANFIKVNLSYANLGMANLEAADLSGANLVWTHLGMANLIGANLHEANLIKANLNGANFSTANLSNANLNRANLNRASFNMADLSMADLSEATIIRANFENADLTGCQIFGVSAWKLKLDGAKQANLTITPQGEPIVTVDNLEVAQFIYLLLNNPKIRDVIDTIGKKAVLILGRFKDERGVILNALRDEIRKHNYIPILFDFDRPATRDVTETIVTLAHLSRFIIADITDSRSIAKELEAIVPTLAIPVQPLLAKGTDPYVMFLDNWKYHWVLDKYEYEELETLISHLPDKVIGPAEAKANELEKKRNAAFQ